MRSALAAAGWRDAEEVRLLEVLRQSRYTARVRELQGCDGLTIVARCQQGADGMTFTCTFALDGRGPA
jgi:hypothetical protein